MPTISIANNLSFDVDIYEVYNPADNSQNLLTYTKLGTIAKQAKGSITTSRSKSQLQAMYTGNIMALNNNYYYQFPVAELTDASTDNDAFTLTAAMQQGMEQAFQFIKYSQANADSKTAKDFRTALANTTGQEAAVNAFFANTGSFKQCTLASWTAVLSWQTQFTSAWQGTYYLYSVADDSATPPSTSALVAKLVITSDTSNNSATLTMADGGGNSTAVVMAGDGSMQEQNVGTGDLSVTLTPVWMSVTQTIQQDDKTVTSYRIGAAFTGTINGVKVAGNLNQLSVSTDSNSSSSNSWDSLHLVEVAVSSLAVLVAALGGVGAFVIGVMQYRLVKKQVAGDIANKDEIAKLDTRLKVLEKAEPLLKQRVQDLEGKLPDLYIDVNQTQTNSQSFDALKKQVTDIEDVLEISASTPKIEQLVQNIDQVKKDILNGETQINDKLKNLQLQIDQVVQEDSTTLEKDVTNQLQNTQEAIGELSEQVQSVQEAQNRRQESLQESSSETVNKDEFKEPEIKTDTTDGL